MNKFVAFAVALAMAPVIPVVAAAPSTGLAACGEITDSQARLACFDRELAKSRPAAGAAATSAAPAAAPAPAASAAPVAPTSRTAAPAAAGAAAATGAAAAATPSPAAAATQSFGSEQVTGSSASTDQAVMHARLAEQKEIGSTRTFNLFLDNGQVWRHEDSHLGSYLHAGDAVTITKAGMGTYRLTLDGAKGKNWIRVQRVR